MAQDNFLGLCSIIFSLIFIFTSLLPSSQRGQLRSCRQRQLPFPISSPHSGLPFPLVKTQWFHNYVSHRTHVQASPDTHIGWCRARASVTLKIQMDMNVQCLSLQATSMPPARFWWPRVTPGKPFAPGWLSSEGVDRQIDSTSCTEMKMVKTYTWRDQIMLSFSVWFQASISQEKVQQECRNCLITDYKMRSLRAPSGSTHWCNPWTEA